MQHQGDRPLRIGGLRIDPFQRASFAGQLDGTVHFFFPAAAGSGFLIHVPWSLR
jgi:hypothetical protein